MPALVLVLLGGALSAAPPELPIACWAATATPSLSAPPDLDPAAAALQAELEAFAEEENQSSDPFADLQYEFILNTTVRWQIDNGDSSEFFNTLEGNEASCQTNDDCAAGVCFQNVCRTLNGNFDPTGEDVGDLLTTFGGTLRWEEFVATARFDTALYFQPPQAAETASPFIQDRLRQRYENQFQPEFLSLAYSSKDLELTLGDYYVTLGRGLVLGVRIVDGVGVDNKLRGADVKAHLGPLDLHGFGGFLNIKNFEPGSGFAFEDTEDFIGGGQLAYTFGRLAKVGFHGAFIQTPIIDQNQTRFFNFGGFFEMPRPVSWASLYIEAARIGRDRFIGQNRELFTQEGAGIYSNINLYFGPVTVLLEGKVYDNMLNILPGDAISALAQRRQNINRLSEPPTAERFGATILANQTVFGGRTRVDVAITPKVVPYVSYGHYVDGGCGVFGLDGQGAPGVGNGVVCDDTPGDDDEDPDQQRVPGRVAKNFINSVFGGVRARWDTGDVMAESGYRGKYFFGNQTQSDGTLVQQESHGVLDVHQRIGDFSTELYLLGVALNQIENQWFEGRAALTVGHSAGWSVTGAFEYTTISPNSRESYPSLGGQYQISPEVLVRALVGGERPGLKCSGGACRLFPGFEGGRLELSLRL